MPGQVQVLRFVTAGGEDFPLRPGRSYIAGRSGEADLVITEDTVSRKHARFYFARGATWVRDLGSRNGTQVNGRQVRVHRLREGDRLSLGAHLFRVASVSADSVKVEAPSASDSAGRSLSGDLKDLPLACVLQWLATSRKTGTLRVQGPSRGYLSLNEGRVCFARIEGREEMNPEKALLRMLSWQEGGFGLDSKQEQIPEEQQISPSLESVLMEAARQQDELAHLASRQSLPAGKVSFVSGGTDAQLKWRGLDPIELDVLQGVAEFGEWSTILDRSASDDVSLTKAVMALKKKGVLSF